MFYFFGGKTPTSVVTSIAHIKKMSALPSLAAPKGKMIWKGDVYFNLYEPHNAMQWQHDVIITFPQKCIM